MKKQTPSTFDCPVCGNPLFLSRKYVIDCCYCKTPVMPPDAKAHREAMIYEPRKKQHREEIEKKNEEQNA